MRYLKSTLKQNLHVCLNNLFSYMFEIHEIQFIAGEMESK
ncbi:hypothetical protein BH11BAC1_BH11BAC1_13210 [soil metagenome]